MLYFMSEADVIQRNVCNKVTLSTSTYFSENKSTKTKVRLQSYTIMCGKYLWNFLDTFITKMHQMVMLALNKMRITSGPGDQFQSVAIYGSPNTHIYEHEQSYGLSAMYLQTSKYMHTHMPF